MSKGFMFLPGEFRKWGWYKNSNMVHMLIHLMYEANYQDSTYMGVAIKRGQLATGRKQLAVETGMSEREVRTCLERLTNDQQIVTQTTNRFSIITVCNYDSWHGLQKPNDQPTTSETPTNDPQSGTPNDHNNKDNKDNKEDNILNPYNPLTGDGEILLSRLTELSEENRRLQEENEELKKKKAKKKAREDYDVRADLSYVDERYFDKWNEWLSYKDKIGKQYKTQEGAVKQYHQWLNTSGGSYAKACAIIDQSIQWSWTGLFDIRDWVEPEEKRDPTIPNKDKYEPDLPYSEIMGAFLVPNKYPDWNEDWPYTPDTRPDGARICNGSNGWRWDAANKRWIEMMWIMDKRQWLDR